MSLINIETVNHDIEPSEFTPLLDSQYPCCFLGVQIKNRYDQLRYNFSSEFNPQNIIHFSRQETPVPYFFRGVILTPNINARALINKLEVTQLTSGINRFKYTSILGEHGYTSKYNNHLLGDGIYPIDSDFLNEISSQDFILSEIYSSLFNSSQSIYFQSVGYISIFILSNKVIDNCKSRVL